MENSIKKTNLSSLCRCEVCQERELGTSRKALNYRKKMMNQRSKEIMAMKWRSIGTEEIKFADLLKYLVSYNKLIKGVPIFIPETMIFSKTKLVDLYKYEKDELKHIKGPYNLPWVTKVLINAQSKRYKPTGSNKIFPIAIVRSKDAYKLLTESELIKFMMIPPSSNQWKETQCIQSYILDKNGLASPLNYDYEIFFKKFNPEKALSSAKFESDEKLKHGDGFEYARKLCAVLGYYLFKVHHLELLSAKITFMRDNNSNFWLTYMKDIFVRKNPQLNNPPPGRFDLIKSNLEEIIEKNIKNLTTKEKIHVGEFSTLMKNNYIEMKELIGIKKNMIEHDDKFSIDSVYKILRPESPYKLSEIINPEFDPKLVLKKRINEGLVITNNEKRMAEIKKPFEIKSAYLDSSSEVTKVFCKNSIIHKRPSIIKTYETKRSRNNIKTKYHSLADVLTKPGTAKNKVRPNTSMSRYIFKCKKPHSRKYNTKPGSRTQKIRINNLSTYH